MEIVSDFNLAVNNTFHVPAIAEYFAPFDSLDVLNELLSRFREHPKLVLGGGSNVLFTKNISGIVLHNCMMGIGVTNEDEDFVWVRAGAGVAWHELVMFCVYNNWGGVENLSLIPGSVGAAPMQNIGAYGVEIKDVFYELQALNIENNTIQTFSLADCRFGYRESIFKNELKNHFIILNVTLRLSRVPKFNISYGTIEKELEVMGVKDLSVKSISDAVIRIRSEKLPDPAVIGNAGSFFKNPVLTNADFEKLQSAHPDVHFFKTADGIKIPAAWLIEQCGFKGYRHGEVGCHMNQPLVIVNYGNATGIEIFDFSKKIIDAVLQRFGIELHREVNVY